ncbi:C2 domain protein [Necator americanus]|uniref:C2 domain protein n=1 Tax=Necator americanus TaxID=51031 RepID=W2T245_NECAM|nr:C2 domain protein [Necator americanus]ETN75973.1 C2 domain protein [Necator americanus]
MQPGCRDASARLFSARHTGLLLSKLNQSKMHRTHQFKDIPKEQQHEMYFVPRLYEVHEVTTTWQLRCYFLWAKDLLPVAKNTARAFVRVTFLTRALQSLVVENSQNPVWNETLIFEKVAPAVICATTDSRAKPNWHALTFQNSKTRGAVLACFELFYADKFNKDELPLMPAKKREEETRIEEIKKMIS